MLPEEFQFIRPYWLYGFISLIILVVYMFRYRLRNKKWESLCDKELLPYILIGDEPASRRTSAYITLLAGTLILLSLAGPTWEKLPQPTFSTQSALVVAMDLSRSMNASDVNPSRLERARFKVADILQQRAEGETALLVYAGDSFTVTPLTDDAATIESQLMALTTDIIPAQGNRTDLAMSKAVELLKQAGVIQGDILLITDEVDFDRNRVLAEAIQNDGYRLSILGIGTLQGAPITMADGSFFKDRSGLIIVPTLNEEPMRQLASTGGGLYMKMTVDDEDIIGLSEYFSSNFSDDDLSETDFETDVWREQGPWLLLLLVPFVLTAFRRGALIALLVFCLPYPQDAMAFEWESLWLRADQRAEKLMEQGNVESAAKLFEDPAWKGAANYRAGNFDEAITQLEDIEGIENQYNLGNALARKGMFEQAISLYNEVLKANPDHEDARHNKELLEQELENQQQQQQQPQQSFSDQNQQQQDQEQQQQDQGQDQQNQDQAQQQQDQQDQGQDQEQQMQETEQQAENSEQQQGEEQQDPGKMDPMQANLDQPDEEEQATEQWLRRIPDDPGGLLRRKFLLQYQQRQRERIPGEKQW